MPSPLAAARPALETHPKCLGPPADSGPYSIHRGTIRKLQSEVGRLKAIVISGKAAAPPHKQQQGAQEEAAGGRPVSRGRLCGCTFRRGEAALMLFCAAARPQVPDPNRRSLVPESARSELAGRASSSQLAPHVDLSSVVAREQAQQQHMLGVARSRQQKPPAQDRALKDLGTNSKNELFARFLGKGAAAAGERKGGIDATAGATLSLTLQRATPAEGVARPKPKATGFAAAFGSLAGSDGAPGGAAPAQVDAVVAKYARLAEAEVVSDQDRSIQGTLQRLGEEERLEDQLVGTQEVPVRAWFCTTCRQFLPSKSEACQEKGHPQELRDTVKRFFKCAHCGTRTTTLGRRHVESACRKCHHPSRQFEQCGMRDESKASTRPS